MYDAFISYRRKDGFWVAKMIRELLKAQGVTAYMDLDELRTGTFDDKLLYAIQTAPTFILILPPNALDRCGEKDDWLTKEIITAVEANRKIIPVLCDGFQWPKEWDEAVPQQVRNLANYHGIEMSQYYIDAMIDKIVEGIRGRTNSGNSNDLDTFFRNRMKNLSAIQGVDLAFHSGSSWLESIERLEILEELAEAGISMRILINSPPAADILGKHMRYKLKSYMPFTEAVERWKHFASLFENVEVRISEMPLLRIYYAFNTVSPEDGAVRVKYYTYGNPKIAKNFSQNFEPKDAHYLLYKEEFEFLWKLAQP